MVFAVSVADLVKVLGAADCSLSPELPAPLLGWVDVGGMRAPIAALGSWLGGQAATPFRGDHVVIVDTGAGLIGLAVDRVRGIATILEREIRTPISDQSKAIGGLWPQRSHSVHILDAGALAVHVLEWKERHARATAAPSAPATRGSAPPRTHGFCFFERRGRHFAVPILAAREVVAGEPVTPVPQAPAHVLGVINLRGNLLPLINADTFLGLPVSVVPAAYEALVVESEGVQVGLFVDRVGDVRPIDLAEIRPSEREAPGSIYRGVWSSPTADVLLVDVDRLVALAVDATTRSFQRTVSALSGLEEDADAVADTTS